MKNSICGEGFKFTPVFPDNHTDAAHTETVAAFILFGGKRKPVEKLTLAYKIVFLLYYYDITP